MEMCLGEATPLSIRKNKLSNFVWFLFWKFWKIAPLSKCFLFLSLGLLRKSRRFSTRKCLLRIQVATGDIVNKFPLRRKCRLHEASAAIFFGIPAEVVAALMVPALFRTLSVRSCFYRADVKALVIKVAAKLTLGIIDWAISKVRCRRGRHKKDEKDDSNGPARSSFHVPSFVFTWKCIIRIKSNKNAIRAIMWANAEYYLSNKDGLLTNNQGDCACTWRVFDTMSDVGTTIYIDFYCSIHAMVFFSCISQSLNYRFNWVESLITYMERYCCN